MSRKVQQKGRKMVSKSKFFEYLDMERNGGSSAAEFDLRMEKRLAKKLKLKSGKIGGVADDLDALLSGIPSVLDAEGKGASDSDALYRKSKKRKATEKDMNHDDLDDESSFNQVGEDIEEDVDDEVSEDEISYDEDAEDSGGPITDDKESEDSDEVSIDEAKEESEEEHETVDAMDHSKDLNRRERTKKPKLNDLDMMENSTKDGETHASEKASDKSSNTAPTKYVAPHLRSSSGTESAELAQVRKQIRGLLNRLSESNVESIAGQISALYKSVGRAVGSQIVCEEVVTSCSGGPRGNEQYAAVFAAFVAGMACFVGIDFGAKLLARVAECFEEEYLKEDNLSLRNLTLLLSYLYVFGVCSSDLIYDFLIMLGKRLTEVDVSTVLTVLNCCGMKLRGDDPISMKNFIASVQSRVNEWKASSGNEQSKINNKRLEFMLETICDIKNNKKRHKADTVQHTRIKKWLQKLKVDDILIRGLKWGRLIDPSKKGQWWLSGDIASTAPNVEEVADKIDKEILETKKMLELAASQRMNTDARRAIFCVIISGEDYIDAFEKLLRLDLPGKQDREIMRVLVECCLQEKVFNKYYCLLASKLCRHDKNHKFTLQYCIWDHYKELESTSLIRSMHLSKFTAEMVLSFSLSLAVLKVVDFYNVLELSPKKIMHFRMLFEALLFESSEKLVWNVFSRIALIPEYENLRSGIEYFVTKHVFVGRGASNRSKLKIARKALNNVEGVVL